VDRTGLLTKLLRNKPFQTRVVDDCPMVAHPRADAAEKSTNPRDAKTTRTATVSLDQEACAAGQAFFWGTGRRNCCLLLTAILVVHKNRAAAPQKMPFKVQFFAISLRKNLHRNIECHLFCRSLVDCMRSSTPPHPPWPWWRCRTAAHTAHTMGTRECVLVQMHALDAQVCTADVMMSFSKPLSQWFS